MTHEIMVDAKTYIGTKIVKAVPMDRRFYNAFRGWTMPVNEDGDAAGYLVEYLDGGAPNHPDFHGYVSWSPKEQFEAAYNCVNDSMTFGHALVALEAGERVCRVVWNGKGMWLKLIHEIDNNDPQRAFWDLDIADHGEAAMIRTLLPWVGMKTADGGFVPWLASQTDLLAKDWMVVKSEVAQPAKLATPPAPYDAELHEVGNYSQIVGLPMSGTIRNDSRQHFLDGTYVHTSDVVEWDAENNIATTKSGTRYKVTFTEAQNKHG